MGDNERNAHQEENQEYQDVRVENVEQIQAYNVDFTTSLRELFALVATSSHSCIVFPPTNATHFDLNLMSSNFYRHFMGWIMKVLTSMLKHSRTFVRCSNFKISQKSQLISEFFHFSFKVELGSGWIPTRPGLLHRGRAY